MGSEGKTQEQSPVSRKNTPITPPPHHPIPIGLRNNYYGELLNPYTTLSVYFCGEPRAATATPINKITIPNKIIREGASPKNK